MSRKTDPTTIPSRGIASSTRPPRASVELEQRRWRLEIKAVLRKCALRSWFSTNSLAICAHRRAQSISRYSFVVVSARNTRSVEFLLDFPSIPRRLHSATFTLLDSPNLSVSLRIACETRLRYNKRNLNSIDNPPARSFTTAAPLSPPGQSSDYSSALHAVSLPNT